MTADTRILTPAQQARCAVEALHEYAGRALILAERVAQAAQRGEMRVVDQYLSSLRSLRTEAEAYGWVSDGADPK